MEALLFWLFIGIPLVCWLGGWAVMGLLAILAGMFEKWDEFKQFILNRVIYPK